MILYMIKACKDQFIHFRSHDIQIETKPDWEGQKTVKIGETVSCFWPYEWHQVKDEVVETYCHYIHKSTKGSFQKKKQA